MFIEHQYATDTENKAKASNVAEMVLHQPVPLPDKTQSHTILFFNFWALNLG